ncbi:MAG: PEGA domain-containing protein [Polyangiaceae bacterium]
MRRIDKICLPEALKGILLFFPHGVTTTTRGEKQRQLFFQEARAAYGGGQFVKARSLYMKALAIKSTPRILANLAQVEVRLEAYKSAANHAAASLEVLGSDKGVEAELAKAKKHVAAIVITTNVEGASVTVDGEPFGTTPLRMPVYVESGDRKVVLSKAGYAAAERNLSLEKGTERRVEMPLTPDTAPATTPVAAGQASTAEPTKSGATNATPAAPFDEPKREPAKANPAVLIAGGVVAVGDWWRAWCSTRRRIRSMTMPRRRRRRWGPAVVLVLLRRALSAKAGNQV